MFGFRDIEILQAIVRHGGFRAAASRAGMSQSAMSNRVAAMERRLGVALFDRVGRGVRLSTAGRRLLEESARLIASRDRIVREMSGGNGLHGTVRLGVAAPIVHTLLTPMLARLRADHPRVRFELTVDTSTELARRLRDDGIEVAVLLADAVPEGAAHVPLPPIEVAWYASAERTDLDAAQPWSIDALAGQSIVTYSTGTTPYRQIERLFAATERPPLLHGSASLSAIRHLIADDFGIGILPCSMANPERKADDRAGGIRHLPVCDDATPAPLRFVVCWLPAEGDDTGPIVAAAADDRSI